MSKKNVGLFFGAGAEIAYGLPSGGRFALDIFRMDSSEDKKDFKAMLVNVNSRTPYAAKWLPDDYGSRSVSTFGKAQYEQLIISSLENKRQQIINFLNSFDSQVSWIKQEFDKHNINIDEKFKSLTSKNVGEVIFSQEVKLNGALDSSIQLFGSIYFSAILQVLECEGKNGTPWISDLKNIVRSFIELLIGAVGEDFLHRINDSIFEKKPDSIDIFDDFCGYFKFDYKRISGLDYILDGRSQDISSTMSDGQAIVEFSRRILEEIFVVALDYQSLIDSYYRYLFTPKTDWAKFCKIAIFLMTVRRYITQNQDDARKKITQGDGYYQDISKLKKTANVTVIGTTNYNTFIDEVTGDQSTYLNGSVNDFYDPYRNKIISQQDAKISGHICVPFLFTQSGIKPLTSVSMSRRYVEIFDHFSGCDAIGVIGFGFNSDDGHINGLFRELIEDTNKKVVIFHFPAHEITKYDEKLRIVNSSNLIVENISKDRETNEQSWVDQLIDHAS
ncbi:MAG: hypothetical protein HOM11_14445 [Methylococcales bacterium]|jgi:hypothetical protein|nr:hypothetical protein [Methylococcales bacterium]MBT7442964.1 hypothetical protein [Methylococcales bacterium]